MMAALGFNGSRCVISLSRLEIKTVPRYIGMLHLGLDVDTKWMLKYDASGIVIWDGALWF
jgi:hypothetical protein